VSVGSDFIVTIHALERMVERFPELVSGKDDGEIGALIHGEVMDALDAGRFGSVAPLELAPTGHAQWDGSRKDGYVTWTADKRRGYVMQEGEEGLLVLTVIVGNDREHQRNRLLKRGDPR
jgi:hypothetical protein